MRQDLTWFLVFLVSCCYCSGTSAFFVVDKHRGGELEKNDGVKQLQTAFRHVKYSGARWHTALYSTKEEPVSPPKSRGDTRTRKEEEKLLDNAILAKLKRSSRAGAIIFPDSEQYQAWRIVTVVGAIFSALWIPYNMAFEIVGGQVVDKLLWIIFAVDIFVQCNLAVPSLSSSTATEEEGGLIVDHAEITKNYFAGRIFWVDLLGVFPFEAAALAVAAAFNGGPMTEASETTTTTILSLLRLVSLVRLHRMGPLSDHLQNNPRISLIWFTLARNFAVLLAVNHLSACIMYFLARLKGFGDHTWLGPVVVSRMNGLERYVVALYQSVVTFSTVGYGVSVNDWIMRSHLLRLIPPNPGHYASISYSCHRTLLQQTQWSKYGG